MHVYAWVCGCPCALRHRLVRVPGALGGGERPIPSPPVLAVTGSQEWEDWASVRADLEIAMAALQDALGEAGTGAGG